MKALLDELKQPRNFEPTVQLQAYYQYKSVQLGNMHKMRIYLFCELMEELIKSGTLTNFKSAIDIGCNTGLYSKIIHEFGFKHVKGIDIEPAFVQKAKENFEFADATTSLKYDVMNAEDLPHDQKYDFILCTEVVEHTEDQKKTVENLNQVLKPGGVAIITLPNVLSLPYVLTWISYKLQGRKFNQEMKDHLSYPFFKTIRLFKDKPYRLVTTSGTNLFYWHFLHKWPGFNFLNLLNYHLSKRWPFRFFTQYFYVVLKNETDHKPA